LGSVAARPGKAGDQAMPDRVFADLQAYQIHNYVGLECIWTPQRLVRGAKWRQSRPSDKVGIKNPLANLS
jgi:hypothetical protein